MTATTISGVGFQTRRWMSSTKIVLIGIVVIALLALSFVVGRETRHVTSRVITKLQPVAVQPIGPGANQAAPCMLGNRPLPC